MKNSNIKTEEKAFTVDQIGVLLERMDEKISTLAESMDIKFEGVNNRLDGIDGRLDKVEGRLDTLETKVDRLQDDMVEVKFELRQKVSVDQFQRLERRVTKLERLSLAH